VTEEGEQTLLCYELSRQLELIGEVAAVQGQQIQHDSAHLEKDKAQAKPAPNSMPRDISELLTRAYDGEAKIHLEPCRVEIMDGATPVKIPARRIPIAYQEEVKAQLEQMERDGVVEKVTSAVEWCAPMVISHKKNGKTTKGSTRGFELRADRSLRSRRSLVTLGRRSTSPTWT